MFYTYENMEVHNTTNNNNNTEEQNHERFPPAD